MRLLAISGAFFLITLWAGCSGNAGQSKDNPAERPAAEGEGDGVAAASPADQRKTIVFFGNSLSAGYGLEPGEDFPALIQDRLDSLGYPYQVINAGVSGETSSGGKARVDWVLSKPVDIFILELGGNDGLRGIPPTETRSNLQSIIDKVKTKYPGAAVVLAGMEAPPNMGPDFTADFRSIYPGLAAENDVSLIPFLLRNVGGEPELNQADGIHPNAEGAKIVADNVWEVLVEVLKR